jgi:hypothetical protein
MDGNATIPRDLLWRRRRELPERTGLTLRCAVPFGALSYAATGGFQSIGLPRAAVAMLCRLERIVPTAPMRIFALRSLFVLERTDVGSGA